MKNPMKYLTSKPPISTTYSIHLYLKNLFLFPFNAIMIPCIRHFLTINFNFFVKYNKKNSGTRYFITAPFKTGPSKLKVLSIQAYNSFKYFCSKNGSLGKIYNTSRIYCEFINGIINKLFS